MADVGGAQARTQGGLALGGSCVVDEEHRAELRARALLCHQGAHLLASHGLLGHAALALRVQGNIQALAGLRLRRARAQAAKQTQTKTPKTQTPR